MALEHQAERGAYAPSSIGFRIRCTAETPHGRCWRLTGAGLDLTPFRPSPVVGESLAADAPLLVGEQRLEPRLAYGGLDGEVEAALLRTRLATFAFATPQRDRS